MAAHVRAVLSGSEGGGVVSGAEKPCWEIQLADRSKPLLYVYADNPELVIEVIKNHGVSRYAIEAIRLAPPLNANVVVDKAPDRGSRK
jgi:hypothetical protein